MRRILASLLAMGALCLFASGCKCTQKTAPSKAECEVATPTEHPAAAVPLDRPAH